MSTNQSLKPITTTWLENLNIGGCDTVELAKQYGTPLYVIDEDTLRAICRDYKEAFSNYKNIKMMYASKALCTMTTSKIPHRYFSSKLWICLFNCLMIALFEL